MHHILKNAIDKSSPKAQLIKERDKLLVINDELVEALKVAELQLKSFSMSLNNKNAIKIIQQALSKAESEPIK